MKSKKLIFLTIFFILVSGCAKNKNADIYKYTPELYNNSGVTAYDNGNIKLAYKLALLGCDVGKYDECNLLGIIYKEGRYIHQNYAKAVKYFTKGCENNNGFSCLYLSEMYELGSGVLQNSSKKDYFYKKAVQIFNNGCSHNIGSDCYGLGIAYTYNSAVQNTADIIDTFIKSCDLEDSKGCAAAGDYYFYKEGDKVRAYEYYEKACYNNNPEGCIKSLDIYSKDRTKKAIEAEPLILKSEKLCTGGASNLCIYLGDMYREYNRLSRINHEKSFDYFRYSCDYNNPYGCKLFGDMYRLGTGIERNEKTAKSYYDKACSLGFFAACNSK